jgi:hypothetical protein
MNVNGGNSWGNQWEGWGKERVRGQKVIKAYCMHGQKDHSETH